MRRRRAGRRGRRAPRAVPRGRALSAGTRAAHAPSARQAILLTQASPRARTRRRRGEAEPGAAPIVRHDRDGSSAVNN